MLALADQAVVSCASFLATIVVSRWADPGQLGFYAIGVSIVLILLGVQGSLISLPYTIQQHRPLGTPRERAGSSLAQSSILAALSSFLLAAAAFGLRVRDGDSELAEVLWALTAAAPFLLLREFGRQFAFAHFRMAEAFFLDAAVAAIQIAALTGLGSMGRLTPATACAALGGACALIGVPWLYLARNQFSIHVGRAPAIARQNWDLAKWLFAGQITGLLPRFITYWLLAVIVGPAATGVLAACMSIVAFPNPLVMGLSNFFVPKAVLTFTQGGAKRLLRQTIGDSLLLGAIMGLFCFILVLGGAQIMQALYHGKDYEGQGLTVTVLALGSLAFFLGVPAAIGLASMERPRPILWAGLFGVVMTVSLVLLLAAKWGLLGAACAVLAGSAVEAAARWIGFLVKVSRQTLSGSGLRLTSSSADREPHANGGQVDCGTATNKA